MRGRVAADWGAVPLVVFLNVFAILRNGWSLLVACRRWLAWRRRRFVVRRRRLVVCGMFVLTVAGFEWAQPLQIWLGGTVLAGRPRVRGQVVVRPPVTSGWVRRASVRLLPAGPAGGWAGLLLVLSPASPVTVAAVVDHAGRWHVAGVAPGWRYAVVVEAEGCPPALAGVVTSRWLESVRLDHAMRSCLAPEPLAGLTSGPFSVSQPARYCQPECQPFRSLPAQMGVFWSTTETQFSQ